MNRLIIIGNGFDIAHGMPTKYSDFVKWYLIELFKKLANGNYEDEAVIANVGSLNFYDCKNHSLSIITSIEENDPILRDYNKLLLNNKSLNHDNHLFPFSFDFKFPILKLVCDLYIEKNWVDIENQFYKMLLEISKRENEIKRNSEVQLLNKGMDYLKIN